MQLQRSLKPQISLDLTPLIDVVFQLVIFFMVATVFNTSPGLELDLPQAQSVESVSVDELRITLINSDELYLNQDRVSWEELEEELDHLAPVIVDQGKSVVVEGDETVPYGSFIKTLDILRARGVEAVNLLTLPGEPQ